MAEKTIAHLVDEMQSLRNWTQLNVNATVEQTTILSGLARNFDGYFDAQKAKAGKDREKEREEATKSKGKPSAVVPTLSSAVKDAKGFGFLAVIGGIGAAITGLVVGALEGIKDSVSFTVKIINKLIPAKLKESIDNLRKIILKRFNVLSDKFSKTISKPVSTFFTNLKTSFTTKILDPLTKGFNKIINPFKKIFAAIDDIAKKAPSGKFLKGNTIKVFGRLTPILVSLTRGVSSFTEAMKNIPELASKSKILKGQIKNLKDMFSSFTGVTKGAKAVAGAASDGAGIFSKFKTLIKPFFDIFRRVGKFLGGPITVAIFSIIDSFIGAFKGFTETEGGLFAKISGAISGAISGLVSGFVGGLLDLGKMAVGFIAGLFGFDSFKEKLAEFSFQDMIFDAMMFPFRTIMKAVNAFKEGGLSGLGDFFVDSIKGIFESIKAFVGDTFGGIGKKISAFFGMSDDSETPEPTPTSDSETPEPLEPGRSASRRRDRRRNARADFAPEEFSDRQQQIEDEKSRGSSPVVIQDNSNNSTNTSSSGGGGGYIAGVIQTLDPVDPMFATR